MTANSTRTYGATKDCKGCPVEGGTCDAPLCPEHANTVGHDRHYCARHFRQQGSL